MALSRLSICVFETFGISNYFVNKCLSRTLPIVLCLLLCLTVASPLSAQVVGVATADRTNNKGSFQIEEASITDIQNAIRAGQTSCKQVVQAYLARAKAYNGVCTALLTKNGASIP